MCENYINPSAKTAQKAWKDSRLNIAAVRTGTRCLGPGIRSVVWVQGCPFSCPGCVAPEWIPIQPARLVSPEILVQELLANPAVKGFTFSGGEPFLQAKNLALLAQLARQERQLNIICFTGFQVEELQKRPGLLGIEELLAQVDILITGRYIEALNDGTGLRGSRNQQIIRLSSRLNDYDFENAPRNAEIQINKGNLFLVGVPPLGAVEALQKAEQNIRQGEARRSFYERV
jgi:anaerobic ribonucleoside-triphosphate reductase activating protein